MPKDRRDHYLPAAYIGRFSTIETGRARKRPLYANDRRAARTFLQSAENLACEAGLYDLPEPSKGWLGDHIDLWGYEGALPSALNQLSAGRSYLEADLWLRNLVPFVTGLFSRGPEPNGRTRGEGRIMAFQEMLAPVMVSHWTVLHYPDGDVVTSDRAVAPLITPFGHGIAIPLDRFTVLHLTGCTGRDVAVLRQGTWYAKITHQHMQPGDGAYLREALALFALNAIFGPTRESVCIDQHLIATDNREWPGLIANPSNCDLLCHLYDYFRIASALRASPGDEQAAAERIDLEAVLPIWRSPIAVEMLFVERTCGGVSVVDGQTIRLSVELGTDLRKKRRAVGDFRQGAFGIFPFEHLLVRPVALGDMCRSNADGRAHRTYVSNLKTGTRRRVDLNPSR